ncbi:MAG: hypothetical protein ACYCUY_02140 [Acidithiobacillus sp.]
MWYALGQLPETAIAQQPVPIARPVHSLGTPHDLPMALKKVIVVPWRYDLSVDAAVRYVAQHIGFQVSTVGPDQALLGDHVPFGRPVSAYAFLWAAGTALPGNMAIQVNGSGSVRVDTETGDNA